MEVDRRRERKNESTAADTNPERGDTAHHQMSEKTHELERQERPFGSASKLEEVERLLDRHAEADDGAVDDSVHRIVELTWEDEGDGQDRTEPGGFFEEGTDRGFPCVSLDEGERPELRCRQSAHRGEAEGGSDDDHVPGLAVVEVVPVDEDRRENRAKANGDVETHVKPDKPVMVAGG